jgi:hypothetical protein
LAELVTLAQFLEWHGAKHWQPGTVDCCLCLADWAIARGRPDPAHHLRGCYRDEAGFRSIIAAAGGVVPLVAGCVAIIDGKPLQRPFEGAIGVIGSTTNIERQWGAIFDGQRWLIRSQAGFTPLTAPTLAIWSI